MGQLLKKGIYTIRGKVSFGSTLKEKNTQLEEKSVLGQPLKTKKKKELEEKSLLGQVLKKGIYTIRGKVSFRSTLKEKNTQYMERSLLGRLLKKKNTQLEEKSLRGQLLKKGIYTIRGKVSFRSTLKEKIRN